MRKQPYEVYEYPREWPSKGFVMRFLVVVIVVLVILGIEAGWELMRV